MAKRYTIELLMNLAKSIGANPQKFMGTRTNITFLGKGPTKNPLFQSPVAGLEGATVEQLGPKESIIGAVEDAMGFASANKLNSIQIQALGLNLENILKVYKPPVLPMASVTPIRSGIGGLRKSPQRVQEIVDDMAMIEDPASVGLKRFPKESHKFFGRPLKDKDFSEIDKLMKEGYTDTRGRRWDFPPGLRDITKALDAKTGMSRAIARQILQQDTRLKLKPEELFMLKEGKGEPLDLMQKYYGNSMLNLDAFLDNVVSRPPINIRDMNIKDIATRALSEVELIPQFAEGGLAEILQAPRSGMRIGGLGLLTRGIRAALKRTHKAYDNPGADFAALMDNPSYLLSPVNMQKIKKLELYRKQLVRDIVRKEGGGEFTHGPRPEAIRADLQLLDDYIAQLKNKIKEVGYYGQGAAAEKALVQERNALSNKLPFSKFVRDKFKHAEGGLARILEV